MATFRADGFTEYPNNPIFTIGKNLRVSEYRYTITTGNHAAGDVFILGGAYTYDDRIKEIAVKGTGTTPTLTGATDSDVGFFQKADDGTFTAIDADALLDGISLATGRTGDLLALNTSLDRDDNIGTLLSGAADSMPHNGVYVGLTLNNKSTAASEVLVLDVVVDKATTN